jgi:hypothetical protein
MQYTREQIENAVKAKGYLWFNSNTNYDVNIVGIRNSAPGKKVSNIFDDLITISYKVNGEWFFHAWPATTDPGKKGVLEFKNPAGVARLVEGQYRGSHTIGLHQGKYEALRQKGKVKVYRDRDKDMVYDKNKIEEGIFGINIHRSNPKTESTYVENWSMGCTVFKRVKYFNEFMSICKKASKIWGNSFTYTLIESIDIL